MSKSKSNAMSRGVESPAKSGNRPKRVMIAAILTCLLMTGGALAQWSGLWPAPQKSKTPSAEIVPASFAPTLPAREYVYAGSKLVATEEPQGPCTYTLASISQSFSASGGNGSVTVTAGTGCNWTAVSNATWITVTSGGNYSGNATVQYVVAGHSNPIIRNGTITIAGQTFTVYQGIAFDDVQPGAPFYTEIGRLSSRSVTLGCQASPNPPLYCPSQAVTREQMAAFIIRGLGEFSPPTPPTQRFQDVWPSNIFYNFIDRMAVLNITLGCSANPPLYCPGNTITHGEMAAFIIRALGMTNPPPPATQRFSDVLPSNTFYAFIDQMAERGIWTGCNGIPGPTYCPNAPVTREQMAALLVRAFNL
jgi:hypothetical protein